MGRKRKTLEDEAEKAEQPKDYTKDISLDEYMKILLGVAKKEDNIELKIVSLCLPGLPELYPTYGIETNVKDINGALDLLNRGYITLRRTIITRTNPDKSETRIDIHQLIDRERGDLTKHNILCYCTRAETFYEEKGLKFLNVSESRDHYKEFAGKTWSGSSLVYCAACPYAEDNSCIAKQYMKALSEIGPKKTVTEDDKDGKYAEERLD